MSLYRWKKEFPPFFLISHFHAWQPGPVKCEENCPGSRFRKEQVYEFCTVPYLNLVILFSFTIWKTFRGSVIRRFSTKSQGTPHWEDWKLRNSESRYKLLGTSYLFFNDQMASSHAYSFRHCRMRCALQVMSFHQAAIFP